MIGLERKAEGEGVYSLSPSSYGRRLIDNINLIDPERRANLIRAAISVGTSDDNVVNSVLIENC